jgi:FkbM family methyltransferase
MGIRRFFKNWHRNRVLRQSETLGYEGLAVPTRRTGMIEPILHQLYYGEYERPEINGLSSVIRPGDRILELGAGLGIISALAGRTTGPSGRVLSYEANPALLPDTQAFLAANEVTNVTLVNAVLVPEKDPKPRQFHLAQSFAESSLLGAEGRGPQGTVSVPAECLSTVLGTYRPDVLICDIEGAELELFPTFPASSLRAAVVELHPDRLTPAQIQSIHDGMASQGLHLQEPGPGGTVVIYARAGGA